MKDKEPPVAHDVVLPDRGEPAAAPGRGADQGKPFVDDGHTSRSAAPLGKGAWKVAWSSGLDEKYPFQHVLAAGRRIALVGRSNPRWQLFDADSGRELALGSLVAGDALLDAASNLLYVPSAIGTLDAYRGDDGKLAWRMPLAGNEDWARVFVARRGRLLVTASFEQALDPHGGGGPEKVGECVVDAHELGAQEQVKEMFLQSLTEKGRREYPGRRIAAALAGDTLVVAARGQVDFGGLDLGVKATYSVEPFEPLALAADERGGAYLVVTAAGKRALWRFGLDGKRLATHPLPDDGKLLAPPVIGADLTAHVLVGDKVMAFTDAGLKWARSVPRLVGATATADGKLLASAGTDVIALDGNGAMTVLHVFLDEKLATAPLLWREGKLLVATTDRLYSLAR